MTEGPKPRYKWVETWPGERHQDYVALDAGETFGRIQVDLTTTSQKGMWRWNITHISWAKQHLLPHSGWEKEPRVAALRVEEHYERLKALHGR